MKGLNRPLTLALHITKVIVIYLTIYTQPVLTVHTFSHVQYALRATALHKEQLRRFQDQIQ